MPILSNNTLPSKVFCLRHVDIYEGIDDAERVKIAKSATMDAYGKGTILFSPHQPASDVCILKQGEVELYHLDKGKKTIFETLFPGDIFGDFGVGKTGYYAEVTRQSTICRTPTNEFLDLVKAHPEMALRLMKVLAEKTMDYEQKIASLGKSAKDQILDELMRLHDKNKNNMFAKMFHIPLRISHQKLAEKTGLNRVTVTKLLGELRDENRLKVDDKTGEIVVIE
ncbi:Crp/Fnr family transcriptional regulator [Candidatus Gracilibacteria bacterium]|nr:Crp/Fnr family transcriptional regulator [Candidatus Gracilibacteria bacterium]